MTAWEEDAIYALPVELVRQIQLKTSLFSKEEEEFERNLAKYGGGGFFLKHPFGYFDLSKRPLTQDEKRGEEEVRAATKRIKLMLTDEYRKQGVSLYEIDQAIESDAETELKIQERREGFAGWLLANPEFHAQRTRLFQRWSEKLRKQPQCLSFPESFLGEKATRVPRADREMLGELWSFFRAWNLGGMMTWELPIPMRPGWGKPDFYSVPHLIGAELPSPHLIGSGLQIFLPWYLLKYGDLTIKSLVQRKLAASTPPNLKGWVQSNEKWDKRRFALMLRIYVWYKLALQQRYADRLQGLTIKLDYAFSDYLAVGGDPGLTKYESVKKIRQKMNRLLKLR